MGQEVCNVGAGAGGRSRGSHREGGRDRAGGKGYNKKLKKPERKNQND
tara:strand:+ start:3270 stop:3413 length:144 start_codon:yes stop_codon:yes gene_type:complete